MKILTTLLIASSTLIASLPLSANTLTAIKKSYTPECGGGQVTVVNSTGIDNCREAKDTSLAPRCIVVTPNQQPPTKQKIWVIRQQRGNDICALKNPKISSRQYVNPKPVCDSPYNLKVDKKGLQDRCIKKTKNYRIRCKKNEVHLIKGLDKCLTRDRTTR